MMLQVFFALIFLLETIGAEEVDPVEFLLSKNSPKNKTDIPLPNNFWKKSDCCSLSLLITVKDWSPAPEEEDYYDSGEVPESDKEIQTGTGVVTFRFNHPQIKDGNNVFNFSMPVVKNEVGQVKKRYIINFDECGSKINKIFGVYASTSLVDDKDIRIEIRDGRDININCAPTTTTSTSTTSTTSTTTTTLTTTTTTTTTSATTTPIVTTTLTTITLKPPTSSTWMILTITSWIALFIVVLVLVVVSYKYCKLKGASASTGQTESATIPSAPGAAGAPDGATLGAPGAQTRSVGTVKYSQISQNPGENEEIKVNSRGSKRNKVIFGPITSDNLHLFVTGVIAVIIFIAAIITTIMYFIDNETITQ